jgi:PAS domain S-box-containing protein
VTDKDRGPHHRPFRTAKGSEPQLERLDAVGPENLLRAIFDTARDAIFAKDRDLRYVKVNRAMCELWGVGESHLIGKTAAEALGREVGEVADREDRHVLDGRVVETESEHPIGPVLHTFSTIKVPLRDDSGEVIGLCAIVRDITARKWTEQALRKSERRLATLMNNLPGMVYRCRSDRSWTMEFVSQGSEALLGYAPHDLIGNAKVAYGELVDGRDADRVWKTVQNALALGRTFELEYRVQTASGEVRWVAERGVGVAEEGDEEIIEGFITDVTPRVEADAALRRRLELESLVARVASGFVRVELSALHDAVVDALGQIGDFVDVDRVYIVTFEGPQLRMHLDHEWLRPGAGEPRRYLGGRSFKEFPWWHGMLSKGEPICIDDTASAPVEGAPELEYWRCIGARAVLGVPLWSGSDLIGYLVLHDRETTRRWGDEDVALLRSIAPILVHALARSRMEAEKRALEHQLQHAQKMEAIGRLAGGVAHDFNNLLTAIGGYAELAKQASANRDSPEDDIEEILKATSKASALTQQLLAFSRRQEQAPQRIDLNDVIDQAQKMLRRMIGEDVELDVRLAEGLREVEIDPAQVDQVLLNLAVNARDAMPHGGRLTISTDNVELTEAFCRGRQGLEPGPHVLIQVNDTGVGMDDETRERIFDPFFTTKDVGKGTGLGLSTVYGVVRQNRGAVDVHSSPGHGATFLLYLPAATSGAPASAPAEERAAEQLGGIETVLVVEDDAAVRRLARQVLENHGYRVLEVDSARRALELCDEEGASVDLVLSDVVMPGLSGRQLVEMLENQHPHIKVVLTSGYVPDDGGGDQDEPANTAFLPKPFTAAELLRKVRESLDAPPGGQTGGV